MKKKKNTYHKESIMVVLRYFGLHIQAQALRHRYISKEDAMYMITTVRENPSITFSQSIRL